MRASSMAAIRPRALASAELRVRLACNAASASRPVARTTTAISTSINEKPTCRFGERWKRIMSGSSVRLQVRPGTRQGRVLHVARIVGQGGENVAVIDDGGVTVGLVDGTLDHDAAIDGCAGIHVEHRGTARRGIRGTIGVVS